MTQDHNAALRAAWGAFCDGLKQAGELAFSETAPDTPLDRAAGLEYVARYIGKALNQKHEFNDPLYPQLWPLMTPTSKSFGDNPDCTYLVGVVSGDHTYRIVGNRGSVAWVSFIAGPSYLNNADLETEWDGAFSITLSQAPQPGNWLRLAPGDNRVFIRQFFGHWDTEEPMRLEIQRIGQQEPPPPVTPDRLIGDLQQALDWLVEDSAYWVKWIEYYRDFPNQWVAGVPRWRDDGGHATELGRALHFCQWNVQPDEALILSVRPPECAYWNFELGNYWMNSVDYRYRLSSLNDRQASVERDGMVYVVVSHADPGIPNWLDAGGHTVGLVNQRWVEARTEIPELKAELVKLEDLARALPADVRRMTPDGRRDQLRRRKIGVERRFAV
ncbi:MAG: hypothetical protein JO127_01835 [Caulobacteraceae bacterium]|nr:hypothetical protein [Caulobacteraceae bacterium]